MNTQINIALSKEWKEVGKRTKEIKQEAKRK